MFVYFFDCVLKNYLLFVMSIFLRSFALGFDGMWCLSVQPRTTHIMLIKYANKQKRNRSLVALSFSVFFSSVIYVLQLSSKYTFHSTQTWWNDTFWMPKIRLHAFGNKSRCDSTRDKTWNVLCGICQKILRQRAGDVLWSWVPIPHRKQSWYTLLAHGYIMVLLFTYQMWKCRIPFQMWIIFHHYECVFSPTPASKIAN